MESSRLLEQLSQIGQKIPQTKVAKTLTLLLVIYSAYLAAITVWKFFDAPINAGTISLASTASGQQTQSASTISIDSLLKLNLFGKEAIKRYPLNEIFPIFYGKNLLKMGKHQEGLKVLKATNGVIEFNEEGSYLV